MSGYKIETAQDPLIKQNEYAFATAYSFSGVSTTDTYYFYFGPKTSAELGKYEYADKNGFGLASLKLERCHGRIGNAGWLENFFLKFLP